MMYCETRKLALEMHAQPNNHKDPYFPQKIVDTLILLTIVKRSIYDEGSYGLWFFHENDPTSTLFSMLLANSYIGV